MRERVQRLRIVEALLFAADEPLSGDIAPGKDAADVLDNLIRGLGMPRSLQDVRIGPEHFEAIAQQAMATPWIPRNPRQIDSPAQVREILLLAA